MPRCTDQASLIIRSWCGSHGIDVDLMLHGGSGYDEYDEDDESYNAAAAAADDDDVDGHGDGEADNDFADETSYESVAGVGSNLEQHCEPKLQDDMA